MLNATFLAAQAVLLVHANVVTMDEKKPHARAIGIVGESIVSVGATEMEVRAKLPSHAGVPKVIDLGGLTVLPGFNDAHVHLGLGLSLADAVTLPSQKKPFLDGIRRGVAEIRRSDWFFGIAPAGFPPGIETREALDEFGEHPILIASPHGGIMNTLALLRTGLDQRIPNGFVRGRHLAPLLDLITQKTPTAALEAVAEEFLADARRFGITSVQAIDHFPDLFDKLRREGRLSLRIRFIPLGLTLEDNFHHSTWVGSAPDWVRVDGVKYFHDQEGPLDRRVLREVIRRSLLSRRRVVFHVLGRSALASLLDEIDRQTKGDPQKASLFRVDHVDAGPPQEALRLARLGMSVCTNPTLAKEWNRERAFPARSLVAVGTPLCIGSDWLGRRTHRRPLNPMEALHFAVNRPGPEQLGVMEALAAFTLGSARAEGLAEKKGRIKPGFFADLIVLNQDPSVVAPKQLRDLRVRMTIVGGDVVYSEFPQVPARRFDLQNRSKK